MEISVVVPVYNSQTTLELLAERLNKALQKIVKDDFEIIYINDGSSDNSWEIIKKLCKEYKNLKGVNLNRNYGQHNTIMCGFNLANGNYIVTIDDDLQNPPEEISKLYNKIRDDYDIVYGTIKEKKHSRFRNLGSEFVQFIYKKTFNTNIKLTSFRIIKKKIVKHLITYNQSFTFIDGVIAWYTSNIGSVYVEHKERKSGKSGYSIVKLIVLALNMLTNFSIYPVQLTSIIGFLFSIIGFLCGLFFILKKLVWGIPVSGYASLIVAFSMFSGVQLISLGLLGEYIGRIHINVSKKPQYAIDEILPTKYS